MYSEEEVWEQIRTEDLWYMDKLILSKKLGYNCGPVGIDTLNSGWYIVRPCVNAMGLGLGAQKVWIEKDTDHLPVGHFWCEWFEGDHISVDYEYGIQDLAVIGLRKGKDLTRWDQWAQIYKIIPYPQILEPLRSKYRWINCEFIGDKLIEIHLRRNPDFKWGNTHFIPVWERTLFDRDNPNWEYIDYPDVNGRIGAWVYPPSKKP